jgi:hypothetical protein
VRGARPMPAPIRMLFASEGFLCLGQIYSRPIAVLFQECEQVGSVEQLERLSATESTGIRPEVARRNKDALVGTLRLNRAEEFSHGAQVHRIHVALGLDNGCPSTQRVRVENNGIDAPISARLGNAHLGAITGAGAAAMVLPADELKMLEPPAQPVLVTRKRGCGRRLWQRRAGRPPARRVPRQLRRCRWPAPRRRGSR